VVAITSPISGATFSAPAALGITAGATSSGTVAISKVDFFLGGNAVGTTTAAPYTMTLTNVQAGSYSLTARATDSTGLSTTSSAIPITINAGSGQAYGQDTRAPSGCVFKRTISGDQYRHVSRDALGAGRILRRAVADSGVNPGALRGQFTALVRQRAEVAVDDHSQQCSPYTGNQQIGLRRPGEWTFPNGTVFVKHFDLGIDDTNPAIKKRLETRFLIRGSDGYVYGLTYKWRADNSDADLLSASGSDENITIATATGTRTQVWHYPSQSECLTCHTVAAGGVLGIKTRQLNGNLTYPGTSVADNQLRTLNHLGLLNPVIQESAIAGYSALVNVNDTTSTLDNRFRSYIDSNCSNCHRPGGVNVQVDARYDTPLSSQHIINAAVTTNLGITGAKVVVPQDTSALHSLPACQPAGLQQDAAAGA